MISWFSKVWSRIEATAMVTRTPVHNWALDSNYGPYISVREQLAIQTYPTALLASSHDLGADRAHQDFASRLLAVVCRVSSESWASHRAGADSQACPMPFVATALSISSYMPAIAGDVAPTVVIHQRPDTDTLMRTIDQARNYS